MWLCTLCKICNGPYGNLGHAPGSPPLFQQVLMIRPGIPCVRSSDSHWKTSVCWVVTCCLFVFCPYLSGIISFLSLYIFCQFFICLCPFAVCPWLSLAVPCLSLVCPLSVPVHFLSVLTSLSVIAQSLCQTLSVWCLSFACPLSILVHFLPVLVGEVSVCGSLSFPVCLLSVWCLFMYVPCQSLCIFCLILFYQHLFLVSVLSVLVYFLLVVHLSLFIPYLALVCPGPVVHAPGVCPCLSLWAWCLSLSVQCLSLSVWCLSSVYLLSILCPPMFVLVNPCLSGVCPHLSSAGDCLYGVWPMSVRSLSLSDLVCLLSVVRIMQVWKTPRNSWQCGASSREISRKWTQKLEMSVVESWSLWDARKHLEVIGKRAEVVWLGV